MAGIHASDIELSNKSAQQNKFGRSRIELRDVSNENEFRPERLSNTLGHFDMYEYSGPYLGDDHRAPAEARGLRQRRDALYDGCVRV